ncbi:MAG: hypothetical protein M3R46_13665 [Actinomycetota bacterium]|nr:hypothetical protein [Actinomycetota bacterium]
MGVKGILVRAAELGYITEVKCGMPKCFCPEELGGAWYFESRAAGYSDWNPTHEHFPRPKRDGGQRTVDNSVLAHRLCNRIDYSETDGRSHARDLERIRKAREAAAEAQERVTWHKGDATYTPPSQDDGEEVPAESNEKE